MRMKFPNGEHTCFRPATIGEWTLCYTFKNFAPICWRLAMPQCERLVTGQRPYHELRSMMNPGLNLHSRSKGEPIPTATLLSAAAETRPPMHLAYCHR